MKINVTPDYRPASGDVLVWPNGDRWAVRDVNGPYARLPGLDMLLPVSVLAPHISHIDRPEKRVEVDRAGYVARIGDEWEWNDGKVWTVSIVTSGGAPYFKGEGFWTVEMWAPKTKRITRAVEPAKEPPDRDPRVNPKAGDVVRLAAVDAEVIFVEEGTVTYQCGAARTCYTLDAWRTLTAPATIIRRAP